MIAEEAGAKIVALIRLARFDRGFAGAFGADRLACAQSFRVLLYGAPVLALSLWITWLGELQKPGADPGLILVVAVLGLVIDLIGFPILLRPVLRAFGRIERWASFVTAYNWFTLGQLVFILTVLGIAQDFGPAAPFLLRAAEIYVLLLEAFLAQTMLAIGGLKAILIVVLDLACDLLLHGICQAIIGA